VAAFLISTLGSPRAMAAALNPGNIVVADFSAFGGSGGIIRIDPVTGSQLSFSVGANFQAPFGMAIATDGQIFIADRFSGIIRVDPVTGTQTVISSGGSFQDPFDVAIESDGNILVIDAAAGAVFRVDPGTGGQTTVSIGGSFVRPVSIAVEPGGDILARSRTG
jgi:streptogramin lyase